MSDSQKHIVAIDEAALDRAVRIVMPDVIWAMKMGSTRNYSFALQAYHRSVIVEYNRQRRLS